MRYTYQMPAAESVGHQTRIQQVVAAKIVPRWAQEAIGAAFLLAVFAAARPFTRQFRDAYFITAAVAVLYAIMRRTYRAFYKRRLIGYLKAQPDYDTWTMELADGWLSWENRGVRTSFAQSILTRAYEKDGFVYFEFSERGTGRLPISVFSTTGAKDAFLAEARIPKT